MQLWRGTGLEGMISSSHLERLFLAAMSTSPIITCRSNTLVLNNRGRSIHAQGFKRAAVFLCFFAPSLCTLVPTSRLVARGFAGVATLGPAAAAFAEEGSVLLSRPAGLRRAAVSVGFGWDRVPRGGVLFRAALWRICLSSADE